jgi:hypothetical protein
MFAELAKLLAAHKTLRTWALENRGATVDFSIVPNV